MAKHLKQGSSLLDLGIENPFTPQLKAAGYHVQNTQGENLDEADDWDKHYHEFEVKQFQFLLEKAGWTIKAQELWTSPDPKKMGIRPLLRYFTPRYCIVYCERV